VIEDPAAPERDGEPDGGSPDDGRIVLLVTSPRVAAGLLDRTAWRRLEQASSVLAADPDEAWLRALHRAGVTVHDVGHLPVGRRAGTLVETATPGTTVVWLGSPDGDPRLTDALAEHLSRRAVTGRPPEVELVTGSYDVPGSRLLDLVAVMDRLRSPGGCPWDAEQTPASLAPYLLEEAHEVLEALDSGDRAHLREELGDLLLQVAFHARIAAEHEHEPFDVDDVAAGIVEKLVRRHPHVFADTPVDGGATGVEHLWETIKDGEKKRDGVFDGIPLTLPALARAQKMAARLDRAGRLDLLDGVEVGPPDEPTGGQAADGIAVRLLEVVLAAREQGVDAESALRAVLNRLVRREVDAAAQASGERGWGHGGSRPDRAPGP